MQRFNYSAEFKPEMTGEDFGSALIRNRRQVSLKTAIGWFWDLLGAGKTVFETVIVFYGFIDDTIKKKKLLHLERQMEEIQDQLTDMTDDLTQSHALHLTLATLCEYYSLSNVICSCSYHKYCNFFFISHKSAKQDAP